MKAMFEQLIASLNISPISNDAFHRLTSILRQQTDDSIASFISQVFESLLFLEKWAWQKLSQESDQTYHREMLHALGSFNKQIVFIDDHVNHDDKYRLLVPDTLDSINLIFEQFNNNQNSCIALASIWFDNLSYFIQEYPQLGRSPVITHINQYFGQRLLMSESYESYLSELRQSQLSPSIFSAKQLLYIKTCSFSLNVYLHTKPKNFCLTIDEILEKIGSHYLQIMEIHCYNISTWSKELLACITHLTGLIDSCCSTNKKEEELNQILFPTEQILFNLIEVLIRVVSYEPFYKEINNQRSEDASMLVNITLHFIMNILLTQNISWYFQSTTNLSDALLLTVKNKSIPYQFFFYIYSILGEILSEEKLKELKFTDDMGNSYFTILEQAWQQPSKTYKHLTVSVLLRAFLTLSKNEFIPQKTADSNKLCLLMEMCDDYPIVYDIIWALSFNKDIEKQLRSNAPFMSKLTQLAKQSENEQTRKTIGGILWNLDVNHENRPITDKHKTKEFDIMISYSHKEKVLCKQIYEELIKAGYRVWIDFDQMHGNVMDAMTQAIEQSNTVIMCMSEQYRKSNYCRAEAQYAFQRERKIVPILLQKQYKPDGWLLFIIGQLLYVDFNKYELPHAMELLTKELKATETNDENALHVSPKENAQTSHMKTTLSVTYPINILQWTEKQVQDWLVEHDLVQMSRLLKNYDGRSLIYLHRYMKHGQPQQILNLLQEDSIRRTDQSLSLVELSHFHSLIHQRKLIFQSSVPKRTTRKEKCKDNNAS
ncbi:unnamed protein product [Rotaria socialis]|uniref:TIR domain-containing protein n=2 Tax=Rotaria socialis TaxID=392032 RepID=A0A820ULP1_9BILA|nr:unnamed protein product [Rotaria socialis]